MHFRRLIDYALRDYGTAIWEGGDPGCDHKHIAAPRRDAVGGKFLATRGKQNARSGLNMVLYRDTCARCGAIRHDAQLGQEKLHDCLAWAHRKRVVDRDSKYWWKRTYKWASDPQPPCDKCYVCAMRKVMAEVWRVLHPTGLVWLNLGDSYASSGAGGGGNRKGNEHGQHDRMAIVGRPKATGGLKPKDLMLIPQRVALALQADGWWIRSKPPWLKKNALPESVTDRPNTAHEDIFLLSKSKKPYYDRYSVLHSGEMSSVERDRRGLSDNHKNIDGAPGQVRHQLHQARTNSGKPDKAILPTRNRRTTDWWYESLDRNIEQQRAYLHHLEDVRDNGGPLADEDGTIIGFQVNPKGYKGAHYAVWPIELVKPMLAAATSRHGACPKCGNQWARVVDKHAKNRPDNPNDVLPYDADSGHQNGSGATTLHKMVSAITVGWRPTCTCWDHLRVEVEKDCAKCGGTGLEHSQKLSDTDSKFQDNSHARNVSLVRQTRRKAGKEFDYLTFIGRPTGNDCPTCDGSGTITELDFIDAVASTIPIVKPIALDCFAGSGSTLVAARELDIDGIGTDLKLDYLINNAKSRLDIDKLEAWKSGRGIKAEEITEWPEGSLFAQINYLEAMRKLDESD